MNRPYDLIVYGATGYLGSLVVQYLWANSPQTLRWAVAGRSEKKLVALVNSLDQSQSHRKLPHIMVATLSDDDLGSMASQTRLVLNTVGPFCKYGTPVVIACIENSCAYVDSTGEHVWTQQLAAQWHDKAVANNAIIVPQCAVESSPPDLMTLLVARRLRRPLGPVFFTIQHTWTGYSGGTIASILASLETYSIRQMMAASAPRAACIRDSGPHHPHSRPVVPVRRDRFLGNLTLVAFPPLRWLLQWLSPKPGTGPQVTKGNHFVEWKTTVAVDGEDVSQPSAVGVMRMNTDVYSVCATLVSEAALTLLEILDGNDNESMVKKLGGGILTPASLGMLYVERLEKAGLDWKVIEIGGDE
ncbi:hypothetical protein CNMCM8927_004782 [Aspergillus lentulus]|uniref:Saccharopine dehydrogenase NADP binding domain-containing protein n=1 Tax=Aspergillus lentulus TaxID=293939 RepID=A0AAN6BJJ2_ASPLE|nr:hypothetical protein CNMCM6069_000268 [Aspergillus lentulus]KAF4170431.1 hypothetical protein CNMCM8060_005441 [Aspergillus lentulus]KAF4192605.1 hypothetical protein CNMCM8694_000140 [Aspergillus lentulus]KAF4199782.1 hypothetical protein CNMCM8927_004782 [Aspergillus lentulus]GFF76022.1 hypothetical protein IFM62136_09215 [Aspergillus lentulus]